MTITIHPCPFCDHDDVELDEVDVRCFAVCCPECEAIGPISRDNIEDAICKWNKAGDTLNQIKRHDSIVTEQCLALERRIEAQQKATT